VINDCGSLANPANGLVTEDPDTLENAIATYTCESGYELNGAATATCTSSGWDQPQPTCDSRLPYIADINT